MILRMVFKSLSILLTEEVSRLIPPFYVGNGRDLTVSKTFETEHPFFNSLNRVDSRRDLTRCPSYLYFVPGHLESGSLYVRLVLLIVYGPLHFLFFGSDSRRGNS